MSTDNPTGDTTATNTSKTIITTLSNSKWVLVFFLCAFVLFLIGHFLFQIFLGFAAGVFSIGVCAAAFHLVSSKFLNNVDDSNELITRQNRAYAEYLKAWAILIIGAYLSAFVAFLTLK